MAIPFLVEFWLTLCRHLSNFPKVKTLISAFRGFFLWFWLRILSLYFWVILEPYKKIITFTTTFLYDRVICSMLFSVKPTTWCGSTHDSPCGIKIIFYFEYLTMSIFSITTYYYGQYIKRLYETLWTKFKSSLERLIRPRTKRLGENRYQDIFLRLVIGIESFFFFGSIKFKARKWNNKLPLKKSSNSLEGVWFDEFWVI